MTPVLALVLFPATAVGQTTIHFDSPSDLSLFNLNGAAGTGFAYSATAGVGGGGGVVSTVNQAANAAAILPTGLTNAVGSDYVVQLDFRERLATTGIDVRLGFRSSATGFLDTADPWEIHAEIYGTGNPKWVVIRYNTGQEGVAASFQQPMAEGNWYRFRMELRKTSDVGYNHTFDLWDLGPTGLSTPTLMDFGNGTLNAPGMGTATALYAGFYLSDQTYAVDNFAAGPVVPIPEPSSPGLMAVVAAGVMLAVGASRAVGGGPKGGSAVKSPTNDGPECVAPAA
jgi:hypothetical protein